MDGHNSLTCRFRQKPALILFASITLSIAFLTGCDKYTKHEVLTFFFTGVPPLETIEPQIALKIIPQTEVKKVAAKERLPSEHGPYAAGECYQCHKVNEEQNKFQVGSFPSLQSLPRELLLPKNEICLECHTTKTLISAFTSDLWLHGPVSAGMCTTCHHPHRAGYPHLLLQESSKQLCSQCHIDDSITMIEEHMQERECTFCHNPHVGKDRFLLKKDYLETY